ncbi:hypothetical protein T484DRAFT_3621715 [Baffinella frigidus]|nr:hypothetical protein T484DRAFT_3621715 [Cryptophyta sp. CCMP2293]
MRPQTTVPSLSAPKPLSPTTTSYDQLDAECNLRESDSQMPEPPADAVPEWFLAQHACGQRTVHRFLPSSAAKKKRDLTSSAAASSADTPAQSLGGSPFAINESAASENLYAAVKADQPESPAGTSGSFRALKMLSGVKDFKPRGESASDPFMRLFRQASYEESARNCDERLPLAWRRAATLKTIHLNTVPQAPSLSPEADMCQTWRDRAEPDEKRETTLRTILSNKASSPEPCFEAGDESSSRSASSSFTRSSTGPHPALSTPETLVAASLVQALRPSRRPTTAQAKNAPSSVSLQRGASELLRPRTAAPTPTANSTSVEKTSSRRRASFPQRIKAVRVPNAAKSAPKPSSLTSPPPRHDADCAPRIPGFVFNGSKPRREGSIEALSILLSMADTPAHAPSLRRAGSAAASKRPLVLKVTMNPRVTVYPSREFPCDNGG